MNPHLPAILKGGSPERRRAAVAVARWACPTVSVLFLILFAMSVPWRGLRPRIAFDAVFGLRGNAALAAEARRLGVTYEAAMARPAESVGKPVIWCVDHPTLDSAYVGGNPSKPLLLQDPSYFPLSAVSNSGGRCNRVLAVITAVERGAVSLRFVEPH